MNHQIIRPYIPKVDLEAIARSIPKTEDKTNPSKADTSSEQPKNKPHLRNRKSSPLDQTGCILLPAGTYGRYDYPDLLIGMQRLSYNSDVQAVNQRKGWQIANTATAPYEFIGNINHEQAIQLNQELGNATPSLVLGREFLRLLDSGINTKNKVYDGAGKTLDEAILKQVFDDITKVKGSWRAEWFDTKFSGTGKDMKITYSIYKGNHWEYTTEDLQDCLMENRIPGIVLKDWLKNATSQGLPLSGARSGNKMYYWSPQDECVAGFYANSDRAGLNCVRDPTDCYGALGVRCVRVSAPSAKN